MERTPYTTTKIFKNGNSQAVRLPKAFRFDCDEVIISKEGDRIILTPNKPRSQAEWIEGWRKFFSSPVLVPDDFMLDRKDEPPQSRDWF